MSLFVIMIVAVLLVLFFVLSLLPLVSDQSDNDALIRLHD